jgi:uncharacterized protein (DUF1810 family)
MQRFLDAQAPVYDAVVAELSAGRKRSHWMWFVFPQLLGLGQSPTARFYAIGSRREAQDYWRHPVLGARLEQCTRLVLAHTGKTAHEIFGSPDDLKLHSCMTLFREVAPEQPLFAQVLERFYRGQPDRRTLDLLVTGG